MSAPEDSVQVSINTAQDIAASVLDAERAYHAALETAHRLRGSLKDSGRATIEAWLNAVGVKVMHTPASVTHYCALAEQRAMDALLTGHDCIAIAVSGLSTMGRSLTKLELPLSEFDWHLVDKTL